MKYQQARYLHIGYTINNQIISLNARGAAISLEISSATVKDTP